MANHHLSCFWEFLYTGLVIRKPVHKKEEIRQFCINYANYDVTRDVIAPEIRQFSNIDISSHTWVFSFIQSLCDR